ncbi:hypothetical protein [Pseudofrankia inefficax]|uniref:Uncharacterized protein n=1 Tax=Pseudofrankia inefficax (strain DSM 45817 / CECT 9037 / DDB 130130 / EuI1c) TaxID=298654 RepID=E3J681_PSEI1|nr:hypothetical protein [Pseudofrankia inefficax]ADP79508.1 hypothetical protein FraEuI1c_1444 [Pseudofrankia inefficax]
MADSRGPAADRSGFVYEAWVRLAAGADSRALGGAVTVALCGHWEHEGACTWPHNVRVGEHVDGMLAVRVVAVSAQAEQAVVMQLIDGALAVGRLAGPDGASQWSVIRAGSAELTADERALVARLNR